MENPAKNQKNFWLIIVSALMVTLSLASNIMSVRILSIAELPLFDAGTLTFPFAFMLGDVLAEVWGFKTSKKVIFLTFFCNILMVLLTALVCLLPYPEYQRATADAYNLVFGYVPRLVIASLSAFLLGELLNAYLLDWIKQKTKEKHLWFRTITSSAVAYIFDSVIFSFVAFFGTLPLYDLLLVILFQYITKLLIETVLGTPLVYAILHKIRGTF